MNWDLEQDIWWRALRTGLKAAPSEHGLVLTEPLFNFDSVSQSTQVRHVQHTCDLQVT